MNGSCFQIGDWILIVEKNKLYRQDRELTVEPRLVDFLSFLARSPDDVFGREELIEQIWGGAVVSDQVVTQSVFELRKILKDGRVDCGKFITTVPKRGYRLAADTIQLTSDEADVLIAEAKNTDVIADDDKHTGTETDKELEPEFVKPVAEPAAEPLVLNVTSCAVDEELGVDTKFSLSLRNKLQLCGGFLFLALVCVIALGVYVRNKPYASEVLDSQVVEFSYLAGQNSDITVDYLADGIRQKLMSDVLTLSDYRAHLKKESSISGILPGKLVSVRVGEQQGSSYLDIIYRNNVSNRVIFSKQYLISAGNLHGCLRQASSDLMAALRINVTSEQLDYVMQDLPTEQDLLTKLIMANHYTAKIDATLFNEGIGLFEDVLSAQPDNGLALAEHYVANNVLSAVLPPDGSMSEVTLSGSRLSEHYMKSGGRKLLSREYEALALHSLLEGDNLKANSFIKKAGQDRKSALYYVITGKLAEIDGDLDYAGDSYSQAFYIDTSLDIYLLSTYLAFETNLESIANSMYRAVKSGSITSA